jgi:hypothetical protein
MNTEYSGSGIIPIIKDKNNIYYIVFFKSSIRKYKSESVIEDAGGGYEGDNIQDSAIRELKEESSLLFNLENIDIDNKSKLTKVMNKSSVTIANLSKTYISYFVYLEIEDINLDLLNKEFKGNMRSFWKNGFSHYTENKDIIFIPIANLKNIKENNITDYLNKEHYLFDRTIYILDKFLKIENMDKFIKNILKNKIIIKQSIVNNYDYNKKYKIDNLISYC